MPEILLSTLNAKYIHSAFGLRYLLANMGDLSGRTAIQEFDINQRPLDIAEAVLAAKPVILGLGIYIWNVVPATELVRILKQICPELIVILGGPEVSHEVDRQEIVLLADHVITGEADLKFAEVCRRRLAGEKGLPRIIPAELPAMEQLALPYHLYSAADCAHRVVYVEASRGCPFTCEFCLSSLDVPVRAVPLEPFLEAMQGLLDRGVSQFKFVDRTFNLNLSVSRRILEFFLDRWKPGLFVHFEMVPDRMPPELRDIIRRFPPGALQFEVGVQSLNPEVENRIRRRQNHARMIDNFTWLRAETGVHIHADLIAGLPGEDLESFGRGFDQLLALRPQEIQVGILKKLRGTSLDRHDRDWGMHYQSTAPYEVLQTNALDFGTLARLRRFAKFWDLFGNSGHFQRSLPRIWSGGSPFAGLLLWSDWLHSQGAKTSGIALSRQYQFLWDYLVGACHQSPEEVAQDLGGDYRDSGHTDRPSWWPAALQAPSGLKPRRDPALPRRQARHLAALEPATTT
jgi:radical SAM superfamily enzyme YgiQ (UPF0313 family)